MIGGGSTGTLKVLLPFRVGISFTAYVDLFPLEIVSFL